MVGARDERSRGPFAGLRRRLQRARDDGSAQLVTFIVGAAVFLVATTQLVHFVVRPPGAAPDSLASEDLKARGTSVLQILLGSSGYPAGWSTHASGIDDVKRLGLLKEGSTLQVDAVKFAALARGSASTKDPTNGVIDYEEARAALGLDGYDLHIRATPVFHAFDVSTFGMDGMGGYRVGYVGHWEGLSPSASTAAEVRHLDELANASRGQLLFDDALRSTPTSEGDVHTDAPNDLRSVLVPDLGTTPSSTVLPSGFANTFHLVDADAYESLFGEAFRGDLSTALALTNGDATAPVLGYSPSREVRVTLGVANLSLLSLAHPYAMAWKEFVDTDGGTNARDDGDFGFVELSPDGGQTWYALNADAVSRSQDSVARPQAPADDWAQRALPITTSACGPCAGNEDVLVAFHWVANGATSGKGWLIDDVSVTLATESGFAQDFEAPAYDAIIIGSGVAQGSLNAVEVREAVRDYVNVHNGRLIVLGSDHQSLSWLAPLLHTGTADAVGAVASPDASNPLLTVPNDLEWGAYEAKRTWDLTSPEASSLFSVVVGASYSEVALATTKANAFGAHDATSGNVVLTAWRPADLPRGEALKFFADALSFGKFHYLFLDVGPTVPQHDISVATLSRTATMEKSRDSTEFAEVAITLYLWAGTGSAAPRSAAAFGTPPGSPSPPRALAAGATDGEVDLTWDAPATNGASTLQGYRIHRATESGAQTLLATHTLANGTLLWRDRNVENGVTYYYNVTAFNEQGSSITSNEVSATPATLATAPQGLAATGGLQVVALSWTPPASNGGTSITNYEIHRRVGSAADAVLATIGTNTSFQDLTVGADPQVSYAYKVRASTAVGWSPYSDTVVASPTSVPGAPVLTVTAGVSQNVLQWTIPPSGNVDLVGYEVNASDQPGGETHLAYVNSTGGTLTQFVESLVPGATRCYRVAALNGVGTGPQSAEACATPTPPAPLTLEVTQTSVNQTELAWTPPVDGSAYDGFDVYGGDSAQTLALLVHVSNTTFTYTDTGLHWDQFRAYEVVATKNGAQSAPASDTIITWGVPQAPTLTATGAVASIVLTWTAPSNGGTTLTGYHVYAGNAQSAESSLAWVNSTGGATRTFTDTGLAHGATRYYKVAAISDAGEGAPSAEANATTTELPGAPGTLSVTQSVAGTLHLAWSAPATGGTPTGYNVYSGDAPGSYALLAAVNGTTYDDAGLGNGTTRYYKVLAVLGASEGTAPALGSGTTWSAPGNVTDLGATGGVGSISLAWSAPANGGLALTGYHVYAGTTADGVTSLAWVNSTNGATTTYTHSGLSNGATRYYKVAAISGWGEGNQSGEAHATTVDVPGVPGSLSVTQSVPGTLHLSWTQGSGAEPTAYRVYAGNAANALTLIYQTTASTRNTTYDDAGLANGQPRAYEVRAVGTAGEGSGAAGSATTWNTPDVVTVTATGGVGSITLTWNAPASNGAALTGYHVYASDSSAHEASLAWVNSTNGATTTFTETGLANGQTRYYKVTAENAVGEGGLSDERSATTLALPGTPGSVTVSQSVAGTLRLSWSAPATGGAPTSYKVYGGTTLGVYSLLYTTSTANTTYDDVGLGNGATRYYQVTAVNAAGESAVGSLGSGTTWTLPGAPTLVGTAGSSHHVDLTITAPASNGGTSITDYQVYYCQGVGCTPATPYSTSNQLTYTDTHGTAALQTWRFKVAAVNAVGEGSASAIISVVTT